MGITIKFYNTVNIPSNTFLSLPETIITFNPKKGICQYFCHQNYLLWSTCLNVPQLQENDLIWEPEIWNFPYIHDEKMQQITEVHLASIQYQISNRKAVSQDVVQEDILHPIRQGSQPEWVKICHRSQVRDFLNPLRVQTALGGKSNYAMNRRRENTSQTGLPATRYRFLSGLQGTAELPSLFFDHTWNKN